MNLERMLREMTESQRNAWMVCVVLLAVIALFAAERFLR